MHWCTSLCSSYVTGVVWSAWGPSGATGIGTLMTNNGMPDCADGTWTAQPGYAVTLSNPAITNYCSDSGATASAYLFTYANVWDSQIPDITPPCPNPL
jgi:hypothetical protein